MADSSFDVVSKVDRQEVDNALNQAAKELAQRFDFRGTDTSIAWSGEEAMTIQSRPRSAQGGASTSSRRSSIRREHLAEGLRRGRAQRLRQDLQGQRQHPAGHRRQDKAKKITKIIRDEGPRA